MRITLFFLLLTIYVCQPVQAQDKSSHLPNPKLTRGHAAEIAAADLCKPTYKSPDRHIPVALKSQVYERYRIDLYEGGFHVDHLIPVSLGGSNAIENLWPQPLSGEWGWARKNKLESGLRRLVCRGSLDLKEAQQVIATDWVSAYKKYVAKPRRNQAKSGF